MSCACLDCEFQLDTPNDPIYHRVCGLKLSARWRCSCLMSRAIEPAGPDERLCDYLSGARWPLGPVLHLSHLRQHEDMAVGTCHGNVSGFCGDADLLLLCSDGAADPRGLGRVSRQAREAGGGRIEEP